MKRIQYTLTILGTMEVEDDADIMDEIAERTTDIGLSLGDVSDIEWEEI